MWQLLESSVTVGAFVWFFSSVHPYVLDQLMIRWKGFQTLLTLVWFDISTGSGTTGTTPTSWHAHTTSGATPTHATMVPSCWSWTPKVHCCCLGHQVLQRRTKTKLYYFPVNSCAKTFIRQTVKVIQCFHWNLVIWQNFVFEIVIRYCK